MIIRNFSKESNDMSKQQFQAAPLSWGTGAKTLEIFIEPTCPFSVRAFNKINALLEKAGKDQITLKLRLQSQPWHMYSGVIVRCVLAASTLTDGKEAAKKVLQAVADHREEFEFDDHCSGANMDVTPRQIIEKIESYSGLSLQTAFANPQLTTEVKWHCKYARQNGIHVSPTFIIDGLVVTDMSSGESVEQWIERLK